MVSIAEIMRELDPDNDKYLGNNIHILWGFSKDFGLSGFRVGALLSHNPHLLMTMSLVGVY